MGKESPKKPFISVCITTYDRPKLLERAIRSVLSQTYDNYDLHIIDDSSSAETQQAVNELIRGRKGVFYWRHETRKGLSAARNTGIAKSSGGWIAFLDDDDEWKPDALAKRADRIKELNEEEAGLVGVVYCGCELHLIDENRVTLNMPKIEGGIKEGIRSLDLWTISSSCIFPRKVLEEIGGFDERLCSSIDHDIWMNLASHGYHAFSVLEPLVINYKTKSRSRMVSDTTQRILGVEQYLEKWSPTFCEWFGTERGGLYISRYRRRVLGKLAGSKLCGESPKETWKLIRHIIKKNGFYVNEIGSLGWILIRSVVRSVTPPPIIARIKADGKRTG